MTVDVMRIIDDLFVRLAGGTASSSSLLKKVFEE
jgi:hypothetical protein